MQDRHALENARGVAQRLSGYSSPAPPPVVASGTKRVRKNRDLVREAVLKMPGEFTLRDLVERARYDPDAEIRELDEGTFQATMHWFKKHNLVKVVQERQGKFGGAVYALVSKELKRPAIVSKRNLDFPLMDMAMEAINSLTTPAFGRATVCNRLLEMFPKFAKRIKIDSVGATLVKLAQGGKIRRISTSHEGNTYQKL